MIYFDGSSAENSHGGSIYMHSDVHKVSVDDSEAEERRIDHLCPATFTYNEDGTVHFRAGGVFEHPGHPDVRRNFAVTGDFEYVSYEDAMLNNVSYSEYWYPAEREGAVKADDVLARHSVGTRTPIHGRIMFDDRRTVVFQDPDVIELILRVPDNMKAQHEFIIPEPAAC
ncbi:hypothetical protein ACIS_00159 [Anaplasma centrale str. Israel]|uniref:Uncharacterized protein n=1 Tax=Anaplasma centrale (strain Israel) TaxID=574556 RepID=D1ATG9_ANACI|nr:hypothetical protein [Anaplasma centrale]ACZ48847.1 hypothetical protein ACIS_00159 [Anaplasma centrale str. Israel]